METNTAELIENLRRSQAENGRRSQSCSWRVSPKSVLETVSAFANGDGGTILLGLTDRQKVYSRLKVSTHRQSTMHPLRQSVSKITPSTPVDIQIEGRRAAPYRAHRCAPRRPDTEALPHRSTRHV